MDRYRSLLLKYFATPRHPLINEKKWLSTSTGIAKELEKILFNVPNVTVELQDFDTEILYKQPESTTLTGQNIIVTFHGRNQGTKNDEILLVGAHYDSDSSRLVAMNDNGSGVVAILECIQSLSDQIINKRTILMNTVIFVLFDVQRSQFVNLISRRSWKNHFLKPRTIIKFRNWYVISNKERGVSSTSTRNCRPF